MGSLSHPEISILECEPFSVINSNVPNDFIENDFISFLK
jgi:hypothetical protein